MVDTKYHAHELRQLVCQVLGWYVPNQHAVCTPPLQLFPALQILCQVRVVDVPHIV